DRGQAAVGVAADVGEDDLPEPLLAQVVAGGVVADLAADGQDAAGAGADGAVAVQLDVAGPRRGAGDAQQGAGVGDAGPVEEQLLVDRRVDADGLQLGVLLHRGGGGGVAQAAGVGDLQDAGLDGDRPGEAAVVVGQRQGADLALGQLDAGADEVADQGHLGAGGDAEELAVARGAGQGHGDGDALVEGPPGGGQGGAPRGVVWGAAPG